MPLSIAMRITADRETRTPPALLLSSAAIRSSSLICSGVRRTASGLRSFMATDEYGSRVTRAIEIRSFPHGDEKRRFFPYLRGSVWHCLCGQPWGS